MKFLLPFVAAVALATLTTTAGSADAPASAATASQKKVFRYAFRVAETGFDPPQLSDLYSRNVTAHIFEGLYTFDPLARPIKVRPLTAVGMPEISDNFRTWTVKLRPGIYFADDEAFKGKKRELVAEDIVYSYKRFADPKTKSPAWGWLETFGILGLAELRKEALSQKKAFDYEKPIEGIRALDKYTVQFRVDGPRPRLVTDLLAGGDLTGAVAREVVEFYGDNIMAHPVGTGPFKLVQWRRSSFIALERNPGFRDMFYEAEPEPDDAVGQAILKKMKGRKLPMIDRVELSIIEENQPRWLNLLNGDSDFVEEVPPEFVNAAMPGGKVAPNLAKKGMQPYRQVRADVALSYFNMEDPVFGGYTPEKIALRRAIFLAVDVEREIRLARSDQAIPAQSPVAPNLKGYDPKFKSEMGEYDLARAKALLDMYGYTDKNGDGFRDLPDGSPLLIRRATQPDGQSRKLDEEWRRNMQAIGIKIEFVTAKWPENLKAARAGKLQMWGVGSFAAGPDGADIFGRYNSTQSGGGNLSRFKLPAMDQLIEDLKVMPDGPEREAKLLQAKRLAAVYAPYKAHVHRYINDMAQPWVVGYRRPLFWNDFWQYIDIDTAVLAKAQH